MSIHVLAGKKAPRSVLTNIPRLISSYYTCQPDAGNPAQKVVFGTSGHRGSSFQGTFNEDHIYAITQAICCYREIRKITGPLFVGFDTHALSESAFISAVEVLAANRVQTLIAKAMDYTPTPGISHAILAYNRNRKHGLADGIVITPSHNPPDNGGIKYNPPSGGPADTSITNWIADKANEFLQTKNKAIKRIPYEKALKEDFVHEYDFITPYVEDLDNIIDMEAIKQAGLKLGADALGGACIGYWPAIAERYDLTLDIINGYADPVFGFMDVDHDGKIRMDCSSPYAMAGLVSLKDKYDLAFANDPDADRHGIVVKSVGLMNPNHYLAAAISYLFQARKEWPQNTAVGKTLVSSSMIDRVVSSLGKILYEVPVGFKWFVDGLLKGSLGFGGEESAGASFLKKDGTAFSTDKDGIILCLLAAEILAKTGKDPGEHYKALTARFGMPVYERLDAPANAAQKAVLAKLSPLQVKADFLAGEKIISKLTQAPGNHADIGGLKLCTENGWFAARPSGTEDIYKIYAESFQGVSHLRQIQEEAKTIVNDTFRAVNV